MAHVGTSVAALPARFPAPSCSQTHNSAGWPQTGQVLPQTRCERISLGTAPRGQSVLRQFRYRAAVPKQGRQRENTSTAFLPAPLTPHRPRVQAGTGGAPGTQRKHGYALMANSFRAVSGISYMLNQDKEETIQPQTIHIGEKTCFIYVGTPSTGKGGSVSTRLIQELAPLRAAA